MLTWAIMWFAAKTVQHGGEPSIGLSYVLTILGDVGIFFFVAVAIRGWPW